MFAGIQVAHLLALLNKLDSTLEELQDEFLSLYNTNSLVFQASMILNNLLQANALTHQQRIIAIFLLVENFRSEGVDKHPFAPTLLALSQTSSQQFERQFIGDLFQNKREEYSKINVQTLFDQQELMIDPLPECPAIVEMRETLLNQNPHMPFSSLTQLKTTSQPASARIPQEEILNQKEIISETKLTNLGRMTPIPEFMEISLDEFNWLSPGISADLHWDNSADGEKKISKCRTLIKKGLEQALTKDEVQEIERTFDQEPYAVLRLEFTENIIKALVKHNPSIVACFLCKMTAYPQVGAYLQQILTADLSLPLIDIVSRVAKYSRLPLQFMACFILKGIRHLNRNHQRPNPDPLPRIFAIFLRSFAKNKIIELSAFEDELTELAQAYKDVEQIQILTKKL